MNITDAEMAALRRPQKRLPMPGITEKSPAFAGRTGAVYYE